MKVDGETVTHSGSNGLAAITPEDVPTPVPDEHLRARPRWSKALAITVDGPAGSGKSTIAQLLADTLGYRYIDTGAMYRALAWLALERSIPLDDPNRLRGLAIAQPVSFSYAVDRWAVRIAGEDVTDAIREPRIDEAASLVARHDEVRDVLVGRARQLSIFRDSVLDGRDCGTRIRPDADLKIYVTADFDERVRRRSGQFEGHGSAGDETVARSMRERDERDARNSAAADDAIQVDTTGRAVEDVIDELVDTWVSRRSELLEDEVVAGRTAKDWIERDFSTRFRRLLKGTGWFWRNAFRLEVHGKERVPDRNCVFIANHSSMWDPAFLVVPLRRPIRYMAKYEITQLPIYRDMADGIGAFPVRRGHGDRVALHIGEMVLRRGESLGIFPEGTRIYEDRLARPRQGAARLALVTGTPIVPVAIYGSQYSESAFKVRVAFGTPHYFEGVRATPTNIAKATDQVWEDVEELWLALRAEMKGHA